MTPGELRGLAHDVAVAVFEDHGPRVIVTLYGAECARRGFALGVQAARDAHAFSCEAFDTMDALAATASDAEAAK